MIKSKPQLDKRVDGLGSGGYKAGKGIYISSDNTIRLEEADNEHLGGVKVDSTDEGGFKTDSLPTLALRYATSGQLGGLKLGDGLVPELAQEDGEYRHTSKVMLRTGNGLEFTDYPVAEDDPYVYKQNVTGGKPLAVAAGNGIGFDEEGKLIVKIRKGFTLESDGSLSVLGYFAGDGIEIGDNNVIEVKIGTGLSFDEKGALKVTGGSYTAGDGIEIAADAESGEEKISARLGEGLEFGEDGAINALANIENAVIIQEADAKYLLHKYTEVEYISGNRIGYAGGQNQILAQGHIVYKNKSTSPNGIVLESIYSSIPSNLPDIMMYTDIDFTDGEIKFGGIAYYTYGRMEQIVRIYPRLDYSSATNGDHYSLVAVTVNDEEIGLGDIVNYDSYEYGVALIWNEIRPPGYVINGVTFPYGCALCTRAVKNKTSSVNYQYQFSIFNGTYFAIGFATEAEYNASVALTYERSATMKAIHETVTEV